VEPVRELRGAGYAVGGVIVVQFALALTIRCASSPQAPENASAISLVSRLGEAAG